MSQKSRAQSKRFIEMAKKLGATKSVPTDEIIRQAAKPDRLQSTKYTFVEGQTLDDLDIAGQTVRRKRKPRLKKT